jgi:hypothetical protein
MSYGRRRDGDGEAIEIPNGDTTARFASCGHRPARPAQPQAIEAQAVRPSGEGRFLQVADFVGVIGVASRTGRFPQLVDPKAA